MHVPAWVRWRRSIDRVPCAAWYVLPVHAFLDGGAQPIVGFARRGDLVRLLESALPRRFARRLPRLVLVFVHAVAVFARLHRRVVEGAAAASHWMNTEQGEERTTAVKRRIRCGWAPRMHGLAGNRRRHACLARGLSRKNRHGHVETHASGRLRRRPPRAPPPPRTRSAAQLSSRRVGRRQRALLMLPRTAARWPAGVLLGPRGWACSDAPRTRCPLSCLRQLPGTWHRGRRLRGCHSPVETLKDPGTASSRGHTQ